MAVARLLDRNGHEVMLWEFDHSAFEIVRTRRTHPDKLPGLHLPDSVTVTNSLSDTTRHAQVLVLAVPAQSLRSSLRQVTVPMDKIAAVVNLAKGVENGTLKRMSEILLAETGLPPARVVTVSGPSHAEEVIQDIPTAVVAAGASEQTVTVVQEVFSSGRFRVYNSDDIIGVELGGSLKNIIAIAAGIADGLGLGDNTKGALLTRGLAEITRLGIAKGARAETFAGLSGVGDLMTTCFSRHSRNRSVGERIGRGEKLDDILRSMKMVAEGVATCRSGWELSGRDEVEMPITAEVYRVLFEQKSPIAALDHLMGRTLKAEIWQ
jgi:glycerol-3-phosphate dehydrogenase (NAD(P)+)